MQASWGREPHGGPGALKPIRTGLLHGESGTWYVPNTCSVPDVFTRADKGVRGADDADAKYVTKEYLPKDIDFQVHTNKYEAREDLQACGLHKGTFAHPERMTMADHDMGLAWPPPKGEEGRHAKFMGMVVEKPAHKEDVQGIMVGYKGHVPRSRDKIGGSFYGGIPSGRSAEGFPQPAMTSPAYLPGYGAQTSHARTGEHPAYVTVALAHGTTTVMAGVGVPPPNRPTAVVSGDGFIPNYKGHKPKVYDHVGSSIYGAAPEGRKEIPPSTFHYKTMHGDYDINAVQARNFAHTNERTRNAPRS